MSQVAVPRIWSRQGLRVMATLGLLVCALSLVAPGGFGQALGLAGAILLAASAIRAAGWVWSGLRRALVLRRFRHLAAVGDAPLYIADESGWIFARYGPARDPAEVKGVDDLLRGLAADPVKLRRGLQARARANGRASDLTRQLGPERDISVRRLDADLFLWRLDPPPGDENGPAMLRADAAGAVVQANAAALRLLGRRPATLAEIGLGPGLPMRLAAQSGRPACAVIALGHGDYLLWPDPAAPAAPDWDLVEDLAVPMLRISVEGAITAANREARALFGGHDLGGRRLSEVFEGLGRPVADWLRDTLTHGEGPPQILHGAAPHQGLSLRVALRLSGPPEGRSLIATLQDISAMRALEAQFAQSQKMQAVGQLAGGIAHDFNNLLTAISGHCDLLLLKRRPDEPDYPDLLQIRQNANRAASLVNQLLAFSRKQSLMPETLDLRDILSELTHLLNRLVGEKIQLALDHDPTLRPIRADRRQLEQVIMNLVVNARDAMPGGGRITIASENFDLAAPMTRDRATMPAGPYVKVEVRDRGVGIPPERLAHIFEPFFTTKRPGEGTGLGLSTVYGIVKQSGGFVFVESELGRGTVFTLFMPAEATAAPRPAPAVAPEPQARGGSGVILLVEDEAPVRAFASRALRLHGHLVIEADSAETALGLLDDPELNVDIVISDVVMPGMDGPTWVGRALRDRPRLRVIFVSGYAEDTFPERKSLIPNSVFLPKPFSLVDLTRTVAEQMA